MTLHLNVKYPIMKNTIIALFSGLCILAFATSVSAQEDKSKRPSPPAVAKAAVNGANIAINYSSPAVKGRQVWGGLVPYGKVWRTGANEATTFETDNDLIVGDGRLAAGKYSLFTIPVQDKWTIIFNSDWDQWGAYKYDESKDVLRFDVTPQKSPVFNERLKFVIEDNTVSMYWENTKVDFTIGQ